VKGSGQANVIERISVLEVTRRIGGLLLGVTHIDFSVVLET